MRNNFAVIGCQVLLTWLITAVCHAQDSQEKFGNWMVLSEQIPVARTYALDYRTYLEFFCDANEPGSVRLLVRIVWDTDELYYSGSFPFTHQFNSDAPKEQPWIVYADVGHTILRGSTATEFVQDAKNSYIVIIKGVLKELAEATFVLDGAAQAAERVLEQCGVSKPGKTRITTGQNDNNERLGSNNE